MYDRVQLPNSKASQCLSAHFRGVQAWRDYLSRENLHNYQNKALQVWIAHWIYQDVPIYELFRMQLFFGLVVFALQQPFSIRKDIRRIRQAWQQVFVPVLQIHVQ
jgi:hypothetical protein